VVEASPERASRDPASFSPDDDCAIEGQCSSEPGVGIETISEFSALSCTRATADVASVDP
jgi:hypothetical protein